MKAERLSQSTFCGGLAHFLHQQNCDDSQQHRGTVERVTFWGVTDGDSWLNNWPLRGRTSYPLLFDRESGPKPAYYAVIGLVRPDTRLGK